MARSETGVARVAGLALLAALAATLLTACGATTGATKDPRATATSIPTNPRYEEGIAFPRWGGHVYGASDPSWAMDVAAMRAQTGAQWVEMTVSFTQATLTSADVARGPSTPTPDDLYVGVTNARAAGLKVYVKPLLNVRDATDTWNGDISFTSEAAARAWFQSYWAAYKPYAQAAASAGASQLSLGAEYSKLQNEYPDQWEWLIGQVSAVFHGPLTYELNHDTISGAEPAWLRDPRITYVGVSMYLSLQAAPRDIPASQVAQLWRTLVIPRLDAFSRAEGKRVLLSEVGYRDTADCLHDPWTHTSSAPADPTLQGAAYQAALSETMADPHVAGAFFWAWQDGVFSPGQPAIQALHSAYTA
ncbi:MAG TPA: hypothetical protein VF725_01905 [Ktedonobacterales bacterium]